MQFSVFFVFLEVCEESLFLIFSFLGDSRHAFWAKQSRFFRALHTGHTLRAGTVRNNRKLFDQIIVGSGGRQSPPL